MTKEEKIKAAVKELEKERERNARMIEAQRRGLFIKAK
jgi:hypothetical protein